MSCHDWEMMGQEGKELFSGLAHWPVPTERAIRRWIWLGLTGCLWGQGGEMCLEDGSCLEPFPWFLSCGSLPSIPPLQDPPSCPSLMGPVSHLSLTTLSASWLLWGKWFSPPCLFGIVLLLPRQKSHEASWPCPDTSVHCDPKWTFPLCKLFTLGILSQWQQLINTRAGPRGWTLHTKGSRSSLKERQQKRGFAFSISMEF